MGSGGLLKICMRNFTNFHYPFEQEHLLLAVAYFTINKINETQKCVNEPRRNLESKFIKV